jgi:type I restriction enzyme S subunit
MSEASSPSNWLNVELENICKIISGNAFKSKDFVKLGVPVIKISNVQYGEFIVKNQEYLPESFLKHNSSFKVKSNDLLLALTRPITNNTLKICSYPKDLPEGLLNQRVAKLDLEELINRQYLLYQFRSKYFLKQVENGLSETLQPNLSPKSLSKFGVHLAPIAEQKEIANQLDSLLAKVDSIKNSLDAIPNIIKRFHQSVLSSAVSGKLTEKWRKENQHLVAPNISSIKNYWDDKFKQAGKKRSKSKFTEADILVGLPESWVSTGVGNIFDVYVGSTPKRNVDEYWKGTIPWVSSSEVAFCRINSTKESITPEGLSNTSTNVHPVGTVILAMIGQGKTRGQVAILGIEACHNQNTSALRIPEEFVLSEFLYFFLTKQYEETRSVGGGNNQKALNKSFVQSLAFPLPPIEEQKEIVNCVEQFFSFSDKVEQKVNEAQDRVNKLTQSILAKAFRGELTAEWRELNQALITGENSAEALLAKIRAEREELLKKKSPKKKTTTRKAKA